MQQAASGCAFAATASVIALVLPESAAASATQGYDWTKHRWVYLIDTRLCIGCGSCVRACRAENDVPEGMYRTWVERYEIPSRARPTWIPRTAAPMASTPSPRVSRRRRPSSYQSCATTATQTPCIQVCPVGASYRNP